MGHPDDPTRLIVSNNTPKARQTHGVRYIEPFEAVLGMRVHEEIVIDVPLDQRSPEFDVWVGADLSTCLAPGAKIRDPHKPKPKMCTHSGQRMSEIEGPSLVAGTLRYIETIRCVACLQTVRKRAIRVAVASIQDLQP